VDPDTHANPDLNGPDLILVLGLSFDFSISKRFLCEVFIILNYPIMGTYNFFS
jgi:hypothetical protein